MKLYKSSQANRIVNHIQTDYGVQPEFLWPEKYPSYSIYRHFENRKWFALIGVVPGTKLGLNTADDLEIINLKFYKNQALDFAESNPNILPGYHMNKQNWITVILNDSLSDEVIFDLINKSYLLSDK